MKSKTLEESKTIMFTLALVTRLSFTLIFIHYSSCATTELIIEEESTKINFMNDTSDRSSMICITKGCNMSASTLLKNINFNVDPCKNFYEFTCGNFVKNMEIPKDKPSISTLELLHEKVEKQLLEIITEPIQPSDIRPFVLTKQLFNACMNEKILEERGKDPLTKILKKLGGWPILENNTWDETKFNWSETIIEIRKLGLNPNILFSVGITLDDKNNTNYIPYVAEASLILDREYLNQGLENEIVTAYFEYMNNLAIALGAEELSAREEIKEILLFGMKIAKLTLSKTERSRNISNFYNKRSIKQLQEAYPKIPWMHYLNSMFYSLINLTEHQTLILRVPKYMKEIEKIIQETPKRVLANYIIWKVVGESIQYLSKDYYKFLDEFVEIKTGIKSQPPREKKCATRTLRIGKSALFVRKYFNKEAKNEMAELVKNIQLEFKNNLENINWMDNITRKTALKKIDAVYAHIAYPDELLDDNKLIEYHKNFTIDEELYFETMLNLRLLQNKLNILETRQPYNKTKWNNRLSSAEVNAYYKGEEVSIELPAAVLQDDFFSNDRPKYMNYGSIGNIVGHEITHGFDNEGRQFDNNGNLVNWWEDSTEEAFKKKAKCITNQYGNYTTGDLTLNGELTQNENIADNGGIKIAYRAYERWAKLNDPEPSLPGLSFTPRQMYWISFATILCSKYRQEDLKNHILTDVHSPSEFRVNVVVSNQQDFAKDFGCPKGSPMNPEKKCTVW